MKCYQQVREIKLFNITHTLLLTTCSSFFKNLCMMYMWGLFFFLKEMETRNCPPTDPWYMVSYYIPLI